LNPRGGGKTKLLTFQHAIELVMVLPGKMAKETRTKFADVITRYMAGDQSLVGEIEANAESTSPIAQMARDAVVEDSRKRKANREDLKITERRQTLEERRQALEERKLALDEQKLAMVHVDETRRLENVALKNRIQTDFAKSYLDIATQLGGMEERDKVQFRALMSVTLGVQTRMLEPAGEHANAPTQKLPTSIQIVVGNMNFKNLTNTDYQQIGRITKNKYVKAYGRAPSKHREVGANGKYFDVNDYYDDDAPMIQDAAREYMAARMHA
jgi:hypothetical protein